MPSHPKIADSGALSTSLIEHAIEFIVVGGVAAVIHGSASTTRDLDIVHSRSPENLARMPALLVDLDAFFRADLSGRRLVPGAEHLSGRGQLLLSTRLGPLDLLCTLHDGRGYDELLAHSVQFELDGHSLRVLDLATLIEVKTAAGRTKDLLVVAELVPLLERSKKQ